MKSRSILLLSSLILLAGIGWSRTRADNVIDAIPHVIVNGELAMQDKPVIHAADTQPEKPESKFKIQGALVVDPPESQPYQPIIAGCNCIVPNAPDCDVKITWVLDERCKGIASKDNTQMYLWSPPGDHEISVTVEAKIYDSFVAIVKDPADPTKTIEKTVRYLTDISHDTYTATFSVIVPTPPIPPLPPPSVDLQTAVAGVQQVMGSVTKDKANQMASIWSDFLIALKSGAPPKTNSELRNAMSQYLRAALAKAGLLGQFPGFDAQLNVAHNKVFSDADVAIDAAKTQEFIAALVWACKRS